MHNGCFTYRVLNRGTISESCALKKFSASYFYSGEGVLLLISPELIMQLITGFSIHFYLILTERCPVDKTLNLKQGSEPQQQFSLSAFRFIPGARDVFVHCQVLVCHKEVS